MKAGPEPATVKQALSAHAAIGLLAGALLYVVTLTGALSVFHSEWQRVEQPDAPEMAAISPGAVQRGIAAVLARETGQPVTTHLFVHMPVPDLPRTVITTDRQAFLVDRDGAIAGAEEIAWSDFLIALHYMLNLPGLVGLTVVGALGVMMLALALSGVVAHPRIFRDAFRLRARDRQGVGLADWHNRLSVWSLPFVVAVALTGALIGMATVTAFAIAANDYGGDIEAVYAPIFGKEAEGDPKPAAVADAAAALRQMAVRFPDVAPAYVILHDPLTAGQHVQIVGDHARRLIFADYYNFGAAGQFVGKVGLSDGAIGQQAAASTYKLHFGNFGGLPVKLAYFLFGMALAAICATGVYIWLGKRRRRGIAEPRLHAAWDAVVWGVPLALGATFLARIFLGNGAPFAAIFWIGAAVVLLLCIAAARWPYRRVLLQGLLAAALGVGALASV